MANYFTIAGEGGAGAGSGSYVGLGDYPRLSQMLQAQQQMANLGRIPGAVGLEAQSSADIASLLNPPALFPDTSRIAAETAAGRGVAAGEDCRLVCERSGIGETAAAFKVGVISTRLGQFERVGWQAPDVGQRAVCERAVRASAE